MGLRLLAAATLLVLALTVAPAAGKPSAAKRLKRFSSCEALVGYAARHVPRAPVRRELPPFTGGPEPSLTAPAEGDAGAGDDPSETNVQEAGVDEPDIVKTDGTTIFTLANGALHAVSARSSAPQLLGTLELDQGWGASLLLRNGRALVLGSGPRGARMTELDVSDPANMRVLRSQDVDGGIIDARLTGRTARVVVASYPEALSGARGLRKRASGWLPSSTVKRARPGTSFTERAVRCRAVRRPALFSGAGLLTVYTVDLAAGLPAVDADAVFTSADTVYASPDALYVATQRYDKDGTFGANTSIHRFDTADPDSTGYSASGAVPGTLLNQFSMSEDRGVLRVASTVGFDERAESRVTTLDGRLVPRGVVGGLGLGERIYAVRFMGDVGYVVTFRQTDPLYTLDLSDPDRPAVVGKLKIPGYSAYLHPVGDDLLLGVGQEATDDGRLQGLQLSLFDVSDPAHPTRLQKLRLGGRSSSSAAEWDHHAFLWWPDTELAVLPIDGLQFSGAAGYRVNRVRGIAQIGRVSHASFGAEWTPPVSRAVVVGARLFTISDLGVKASELESFADAGWAAFPQPPEQDLPIHGEPPSPLPG